MPGLHPGRAWQGGRRKICYLTGVIPGFQLIGTYLCALVCSCSGVLLRCRAVAASQCAVLLLLLWCATVLSG